MTKIDVLDHGYVRLLSYMQPVPTPGPVLPQPGDVLEQDEWNGDLEIVRNARTSYNAEPRGDDADRKLIEYLYSHRHTTPFEAMVFTFEIKCPLFIARQWHRHRTWSYNEVSARYTELPAEFYVPDPSKVGEQSKINKQVRDIAQGAHEATERAQAFCELVQDHSMNAFTEYQWWLKQGIPRELARMLLPLNTYTRFHGTVDLHNLFHFIELRVDSHAQWEMQQYALALRDLIAPIVPASVNAFYKGVEGFNLT